MDNGKKLLTPKQLAGALEISRSTVMRHYHAGVIPGVPVGRYVRFELAEVMAALKGKNNET
jgi:excisionase family DNA binding protein